MNPEALKPATHDCRVEAVEQATTPDARGSFVVSGRCAVCGRVAYQHTDSIL